MEAIDLRILIFDPWWRIAWYPATRRAVEESRDGPVCIFDEIILEIIESALGDAEEDGAWNQQHFTDLEVADQPCGEDPAPADPGQGISATRVFSESPHWHNWWTSGGFCTCCDDPCSCESIFYESAPSPTP